MPDDDTTQATAVQDPPADAGEGEAKPEAKAEPEAKTEPAEAPKDYIIHPTTAQRIPLEPGEKDWLAQQGFVRLQEQKALEQAGQVPDSKKEQKSEPKPEPAAAQDDDVEEDAAMLKVKELQADLKKAQEALTGIQQKEQQREAAQQAEAQQAQTRRMIDELARQNGVDQADEVDRGLVEDRANRIAANMQSAGRVMTFADCYAQAAKEIGERLAGQGRSWLEGKKKTAESAPEPPGSASAAELPPTTMPQTREDNRRLKQEMEDGTVQARAHERFNRIMAGATD